MSVSLYLNILFLVEHTLSKGWSKVPNSNSLYITTLYRKWEVQDQHAWTGPTKKHGENREIPTPIQPCPISGICLLFLHIYFHYNPKILVCFFKYSHHCCSLILSLSPLSRSTSSLKLRMAKCVRLNLTHHILHTSFSRLKEKTGHL